MYAYTVNKIISLLLPVGIIALTATLIPGPQSWTVLLVGVSLLGYTHFILGAYYQHQAWRRRGQYGPFLVRFLLLSGVTIGLVVLAFSLDGLWLVALLTIPYFVWHGYENEHTLFTRATGQQLSPWLLGGMSVVAVGATLDAFRHTSAYFTEALIYTNHLVPPAGIELACFNHFLHSAGTSLMLLGSVAIWYATLRHQSRVNLIWSVVAVAALLWFWIANPLPYIWLFVFLLGYHFLTWGIHFGVVFWPEPKKFRTYLLAHGGVVVGVVAVSMMIGQVTSEFPLGLLNTEWFVTATLVHISTSFINDRWLQKLLRL